jgi:hypothetical protein
MDDRASSRQLTPPAFGRSSCAAPWLPAVTEQLPATLMESVPDDATSRAASRLGGCAAGPRRRGAVEYRGEHATPRLARRRRAATVRHEPQVRAELMTARRSTRHRRLTVPSHRACTHVAYALAAPGEPGAIFGRSPTPGPTVLLDPLRGRVRRHSSARSVGAPSRPSRGGAGDPALESAEQLDAVTTELRRRGWTSRPRLLTDNGNGWARDALPSRGARLAAYAGARRGAAFHLYARERRLRRDTPEPGSRA